MLSEQQKYLMGVMAQLRYIRSSQLFRFFAMRFGSREIQFDKDIHQLCYLNKLSAANGFLSLPGCRRDDGLIDAVEIMLQFANGHKPEFSVGRNPCKLVFFLNGSDNRVNAFKIYPVHTGKEAQISAQADADHGRIHTVLFHIESREQIDFVYTEHPFHFVLWENEHFVFLKGAQ